MKAVSDPIVATSVSFQLLIDKLRWGRYKGQQLPASLQVLLLPGNGSPPPSNDAQVGPIPDSPDNGGGGHPPGREGNPVQNPYHIVGTHILYY